MMKINRNAQALRFTGFAFTLLIGATIFSGCGSDDVSLPDLNLNPPKEDFQNLIAGPVIDGTWKSTCVQSWRHEGDWQVITMTIQGQNISRRVDLYSTQDCSGTGITNIEEGLYRYTAQNQAGNYDIEYRFNMSFGTYKQEEVVKLDGKTLWISDEVGGDGETNVPLTLNGSPDPSPSASPTSSPTPNPTASHVASVGDTAVYSAVYWTLPQTETYVAEQYDSTSGSWSVSYNVQGSSPDAGTDSFPTLWSTLAESTALSTCVGNGGSLETVTVAAGTFDTCLQDNGTTKIWRGNIPILGYVKVQYDDGSYSGELQSYRWADAPQSP